MTPGPHSPLKVGLLSGNTGGPGVPILAGETLRHGLFEGSRLLTAKGELGVEKLRPGDRVVTRNFGMAAVRQVICTRMPVGAPQVRIPANALGRNRPEGDAFLLCDQPVVVRDWRAQALFGAREARVAAERLADGKVIHLVPSSGCPVWSLVFEEPAVLYMDG
ncbi:MAG: Hint domain-containing protein, partial [Pseudomonadota bacterium]